MSGQIEFSVEGDQRKSHFPILFINFKSHVKTFYSQEQLLPPKLHLSEIGTAHQDKNRIEKKKKKNPLGLLKAYKC